MARVSPSRRDDPGAGDRRSRGVPTPTGTIARSMSRPTLLRERLKQAGLATPAPS
jgi:hypothetical protein